MLIVCSRWVTQHVKNLLFPGEVCRIGLKNWQNFRRDLIFLSLRIYVPVGYDSHKSSTFSGAAARIDTDRYSLNLTELSWWATEYTPAPNGFCCTCTMCRGKYIERGWCLRRTSESLVVLHTVVVGCYLSRRTIRRRGKRKGNRYVHPKRYGRSTLTSATIDTYICCLFTSSFSRTPSPRKN